MDNIERRIIEIIDKSRERLLAFARESFATAEGAFEEFGTAARVAGFLRSLGLEVEENIAVTGVAAAVGDEKKGPCLAVIGELDGILCMSHPLANQKSGGFSHACGHHAQIAAMLGAAIALSDKEVEAALDGAVKLMAVSAEEFVPVAKRKKLIAEGKARRCSGKSEMICNGDFDSVDIALTTHVHMMEEGCDLLLGNAASNGTLTKVVTIRGRAAHAAASPHEGVNALSAAALGLSAIGLLRETFREKDTVRIHTNIVRGGDVLNVVPDTVVIDGMIRCSNLEALESVSQKFDRAFENCARALGAAAEIETWQGYMPVRFEGANDALRHAAGLLNPRGELEVCEITAGDKNSASTDVGDLSHVMPVVNFTHSGVKGALHSADFEVVDEEKAFIMPAKMFALTAYRLLRDNASEARAVLEGFEPAFTRQGYAEYVSTFK